MKLDLDTLLTPRLSWQFIVAWALAATGAIAIGVIPALWINSRRASASAAESTSSAEVKPATDDDGRTQHMSVEPIETSPPSPPAAAGSAGRVEAAVPSVPAASTRTTTTTATATVVKPSKTSRPKADRVKQSTSRTPKREAAPCDVYLHPHGCPH